MCNRLDCDDEYIGKSTRTFGERFKVYLKPSSSYIATSPHHHIGQLNIVAGRGKTLLRLMTHTARIRGVFDVVNSPRYRVGIAPMLFQWSHSHIAHFSSRIRRDFFPAQFFRPRPLFIVRFFVCRANFPVQTGCTAVCFP